MTKEVQECDGSEARLITNAWFKKNINHDKYKSHLVKVAFVKYMK
jgi:hypothetical protein